MTLLPYVPDPQVRRDDLQSEEIAATGSFLGHLHNVLAECPMEDIPPVRFDTDRETALSGIERLLQRLGSLANLKEEDEWALQRLVSRREWLRHREPEDSGALQSLPYQVLHGDYHDGNFFFRDGAVSAIIDWDKVYTGADAWEVVRTLHLMLGFKAEASQIFLDAYRTRRPLSLEALEVAAGCYGLMRAYDLWLYEGIYLEGNNRLRQFLKPGSFVPVEEDWALLRPRLGEP